MLQFLMDQVVAESKTLSPVRKSIFKNNQYRYPY
jgi:hypothetical protein